VVLLSFPLFNGDLFKVRKPGRWSSLSLHALGEVGAVFRVLLHVALGLDAFAMIPEFVNHWTLGMVVFVGSCRLRVVCKVALGLEVVLQLVDDRPGRTQVAILDLGLGMLFKGTLRSQMILDGGHDVAP